MATEFIQEDLFVGKQILIDSDRIVFNSKSDSIVSSDNLLLLKTNGEFHVNTGKNSVINTPQIFIGPTIEGELPNIPAVKSNELKEILKDLLDSLEIFFAVSYPQTAGLSGPNKAINKELGQSIVDNVSRIRKKLDNIDSENVFIR